MMPSFDEFTFFIPPLWEKEWKEAIDEAKAVDKKLLLFQARLASLLKAIQDYTITPERLAWFSFWSKTFLVLDSACSALVRDSEYTLQMLARASLENSLHARTVMKPLFKVYDPDSIAQEGRTITKSEEEVWSDVIDRLRGYTAWCLWYDKKLYEEHLAKGALDELWNPEPALRIKNDPAKLALYEMFSGPLDIETDSDKLQEERTRFELGFRTRLDKAESWLNHHQLREWVKKLESLAKKHPPSLNSLFDENKDKIRERLAGLKIGFVYTSYKLGSMILHGSTLDSNYVIVDQKLMPVFSGSEKEAELLAREIGNSCDHVIILLALMQKRLWLVERESQSTEQ